MIIFYIAKGFNTKLNAVILAQDKWKYFKPPAAAAAAARPFSEQLW